MLELMPLVFEAIKYLVLGIFGGLIVVNIIILGALMTHHLRFAAKMQRLLDRFAWPLRMGG